MQEYIVKYVYTDNNGKVVDTEDYVHAVNRWDACEQIRNILEKQGIEAHHIHAVRTPH